VAAERNFRASLVLGYDATVDKDAVGRQIELLYEHISNELETGSDHSLSVELTPLRPRSASEWPKGLIRIFDRYDLIHIQYPMEGWGTSTMPGLLPGFLRRIPPYRRARLVTTFHEWHSMHPLRKASVVPLALSSDGVLFTSNHERNAFEKSPCYRLRLVKPPTRVIPVGVNLTLPELHAEDVLAVRKELLYRDRIEVDVLLGYFGFVYASKQPGKMLRTLKVLLQQGTKARLVIAGDFSADHASARENFFRKIKLLGLEDHVAFLGFVEDETHLAQILSACDVVLLLFADGASARRTSLWTVLELGVPVITTEPTSEGEFDGLLPEDAGENLRFVGPAEEPESLAATVERFGEFRPPRQRRGISMNWRTIAGEHIAFYRKVLETRT
jgi:glycosyltransferase involved in cell wall biosynthesis